MPRHALTLPDLGLGERPIKLSMWLVRRGSSVVEGDRMAEVLAGEVTVDLPSPATGLVVKRLVAEDELIRVGQRLAIIESEEETAEE